MLGYSYKSLEKRYCYFPNVQFYVSHRTQPAVTAVGVVWLPVGFVPQQMSPIRAKVRSIWVEDTFLSHQWRADGALERRWEQEKRRKFVRLCYQIVLVQTFKNVLLMSGFGEQKNDILLMQEICAGDLSGRKRHGFSIMNLKLHKTIKNRFGWHKWQKPSINQSLNVSKNVI